MSMILTTASIAPFLQSLSERGRSKNTTKGYSKDVELFFVESNHSSLPVELYETEVARYINWKKVTEWKPKTTHRKLTSLREFGKFHGLPQVLQGFKLPSAGQTIPHPLPNLDADLQRMLDACKTDKQRALVACLGLEGMRLHEALELPVSSINIQEMSIFIAGKGGKYRTIPITKRAWKHMLPHYLEMAVTCKNGNFINYSDRGARNFITELGVAACISRPIASHDLRMTFATLAYASTNDIASVQGWLGHSDVNTTRGYVDVSLETMRQVGEF